MMRNTRVGSAARLRVLKHHRNAVVEYSATAETYRVVDDGAVLGVGRDVAGAWEDADRNTDRQAVPELPKLGSPTMSLRDDEQFWKRARAS